jgi:MFS family permease
MLMGTAGTAISCLLFGFSSSYWMAIVSRLIGGLLNCNTTRSFILFSIANWAIAKAYAGKITDSTNKSDGFSLIALTAGVGSISIL